MMDRYPQPPVTEMNIDLRMSSVGWDWTMPGQMKALVGHEYSGAIRSDPIINLAPKVVVGVSRVLLTADEGWLLGLMPNSLQLHTKGRYPDWRTETVPRLQRAIDAYDAIRPSITFNRVGLRYQNMVRIPTINTEEFARWLNGLPALPPDATAVSEVSSSMSYQLASGFAVHVQVRCMGASGDGTAETSFLLDIDTAQEFSEGAHPLSTAVGMLDELHSAARSTFEHLITDQTRERFK